LSFLTRSSLPAAVRASVTLPGQVLRRAEGKALVLCQAASGRIERRRCGTEGS
jgi:hypothetical protein